MSRDIDPRSEERERFERERTGRASADDGRAALAEDPREALTRELELPRGRARERVQIQAHDYVLRGSEVRVLATVGSFRCVPANELRHLSGRTPWASKKELAHLRDLGLIQTTPYVVERTRTAMVTLTERGRALLEASRRTPANELPQVFYAGLGKERELAHDSRLYQAYRAVADRLRTDGSRVRRVVLDYELKREYQTFLQAPNRGRRDSSGRPRRDSEEIARWARERQLPMLIGVKFPDVRIEYETRDGRRDFEDVEVTTPHYRGRHAASKVAAGFTRYRAGGARIVGHRGAGRSGRARDPRLAEDMLS